MTVNSSSGCPVIQIASYWGFLSQLKYFFALIGLVSGILICSAGRLFLKYIVFVAVVCSTITATDLTLVLITSAGLAEVAPFVYWLAFFVSGLCGLLLAWLSTVSANTKAFSPLILAAWTGFELGNTVSNLLYVYIG